MQCKHPTYPVEIAFRYIIASLQIFIEKKYLDILEFRLRPTLIMLNIQIQTHPIKGCKCLALA